MKKGLLLTSLLSLINLASAYGGSTNLYIGNFYINPELLFFSVAFCAIFAATAFTLAKTKIIKNPAIIAIFFSLFAVYGLYKLNFDIENIFLNIGIADFLIDYGVLIFVTVIVFIIIKWDLGTALEFIGSIFLLLAILGIISEEIIKNWIPALIIGLILFFLGMKLRKKYTYKQKRKIVKWRNTGKKIGKGMAQGYSRVQRYLQDLRKSNKRDEKEIENEIKEIKRDLRKNPENRGADKTRLARLYGIKNLEIKMDSHIKELNSGYLLAEDLHKRATKLGWNSAGMKRKSHEEIKAEDNTKTRRKKERLFQRRVKDAREAYKKWYRQHQKNLRLQKEITEIKNRIDYLKNKI